MRRFVGLMSGTSVDAVDAALLEIDEACGNRLRTAAFASTAIDDPLRDALQALQASGPDELARSRLAGQALADRYADAVERLLAEAGLPARAIEAIGAHGQTVRHRPDLGYTIQLLDAARLAERCGIAVVSDLRAADIAAGGEGAPLVPAFHAHVFRSACERRAIVNLGGIANVTLLPADCGSEEPVGGFDVGPANTLLDLWCTRHTGRRFDHDGEWARGGDPHAALLATLLADPWFERAAPKSTGRDRFHLDWLDRAIVARAESADQAPSPIDVQATLVELTAIAVARACAGYGSHAVYVCGGGARNGYLLERLAARLEPVPVQTTDVLGIDPQAVEAAAFAWLAAQCVDAKAGNLPAVTGARGPRVLGTVADPRVGRRAVSGRESGER